MNINYYDNNNNNMLVYLLLGGGAGHVVGHDEMQQRLVDEGGDREGAGVAVDR